MKLPFSYKKILPLLGIMLMFAFACKVHAQSCEKLQSSQITVTDALCEGGGAIAVTGLSDGQYTVLKGPGIDGEIKTNDNNYIKLNQGTFDLLLYCPGSTTPISHSVVVANKYSPLQLSLNASMDCPNKGSIMASASQGYNLGGAGVNYRYALWKSDQGDASRLDSDLTYGSTSNWSDLAQGTYFVRVKDNCDNFTTQTIAIAPKYPRHSIDPANAAWQCTGSGSGRQLVVKGVIVQYNGTTANGQYSPESFPGAFSYSVYAYKAGESCSASTAGGTLIVDNKLITDLASMQFTLDADVTGYKIVLSSTCEGIIDTDCYQVPAAPAINLSTFVTSNCDNTARVAINIGLSQYITTLSEGTLTITSSNPAFTTITVSAPSASNVIASLDPAYAPYTIRYVDKCGVNSQITWDGALGEPKLYPAYTVNCRDFGSTDVALSFSGDVRGLNEKDTKFELWDESVSPAQLVATQTGLTASRTVVFINVPAGKNYKVKVIAQSSACGSTDLDLTIPASVGFHVTEGNMSLVYNCPAGNTVSYNGYSSNITGYGAFQTHDSNGASFNGSPLNNLAPGNYTYEYLVIPYQNTGGCHVKLTGSFTIAPPPTTPSITKLVAITCQDAGGAQKTIGSAYITYQGNGPFRIEYKKESESTYNTVATNVSTTTYTLENLTAGVPYVVRITDKCGNAVTQRAAVKPLTPFLITNKFQPCVGQPYTLSGVQVDFATYTWTKDGDPSFSKNTREVTFSPFTEADNGTYVLTVTLPNNCVVAKATITVTSDNCGQSFPLGSIGDYTWLDSNKDGIQDAGEKPLAGVAVSLEVYVGGLGGDMADDRNWTSIPDKPAQVTNSEGKYLFSDLPAGTYRVLFGAPTGYLFTKAGTEMNNPGDSNADKTTGLTQPISITVDGIASGDIRRDNLTIDAGFIPNPGLPVKLVAFEAHLSGENAAELTWSTTEEINSRYFEIERSIDLKNWVPIGRVNSAGNNFGLKKYNFEDVNPLTGKNYYHLKMVDIDGTYAYSRIANVDLGGDNKLLIYPNPIKDHVYLKSAQEIVSSEVFSISGQRVYHGTVLSSDHKMSLPNLKTGIYLLKVQYKSGKTEVRKIVVQ